MCLKYEVIETFASSFYHSSSTSELARCAKLWMDAKRREMFYKRNFIGKRNLVLYNLGRYPVYMQNPLVLH